MDEAFRSQLEKNGLRFQRAVERIAETYSKLQNEGDAIEVDLNNTRGETLRHYMTLSKKNIYKLESKNLKDVEEDSLFLQDNTRESQLDFTRGERSGNFETICLSEDDVTFNDSTKDSASSLDENQSNYTLFNDQPEDQDEQLEISLQSQGSSLGDLYPNMISQLGKVWHRQHVSEAADSVLRRYRRLRLSNKNNLTNSLRSEKTYGEVFNQHHMTSPVKSLTVPSTSTKPYSHSPAKSVTNVLGHKSQCYCSPVRKREAPQTAYDVMDLSSVFESDKIVLNKTFTVPKRTDSSYTFSPSRTYYSPKKQSQDFSLIMNDESFLSLPRLQGSGISVCELDNTVMKERHDVYASPVRQNPYNARLGSRETFNERRDIRGSPVRKSPFKFLTSNQSPRESSCIGVSTKSPYMPRELKRQNLSTFLPSPTSTVSVPKRTLEYPEPRSSPQQPQWSPQLTKSRRQHHGLRRHLSFDSSSLSSSRASYSTKEFDDNFTKLYHKLVCLNKSSYFKSHPCRYCANNSDASRGHPFSNLAALALSPHRPLLRKRHRDLDSYPHSKRSRNGLYT